MKKRRSMEKKLRQILPDNFDEVQESPVILSKEKLSKVLELADLFPAYLKSKEENGEDFDEIFVEVSGIVSQYERFQTTLKTVCQKLVLYKKITAEDADLAQKELSATEFLTIEDLPKKDQDLERDILQTFSTNATLASGIIEEGAELDLLEMEVNNFDPRIINHLRKTALDQYCLQGAIPVPEKYEELSAFKKEDQESKLVEFRYVNATRMDRLSFPRFAEFVDAETGKNVRHLGNEHHEEIKVVHCSIHNKNVKVKLKLWEGSVRGEYV